MTDLAIINGLTSMVAGALDGVTAWQSPNEGWCPGTTAGYGNFLPGGSLVAPMAGKV